MRYKTVEKRIDGLNIDVEFYHHGFHESASPGCVIAHATPMEFPFAHWITDAPVRFHKNGTAYVCINLNTHRVRINLIKDDGNPATREDYPEISS